MALIIATRRSNGLGWWLLSAAAAMIYCVDESMVDELDSIAGKRESANKDMEVRIVAQLASCLD